MKMFNKNFMGSAFAVVLFLAGPVAVFAAGPAPVDFASAGDFTVLSKTGITNTGSHTSHITGDIGSSPVTAAAMSNVFCSEITGNIMGVDAAYVGSGDQTCFSGNPPSANKTAVDNAVLDMGTAYADAAGRTNPTATELGAGNIGGLTIAPGLYKWATDVTIPTDVTLSGAASDVWIFQIAGNLDIASAGSVATGIKVNLAGGAKASNVFWQVGGVTGATLGTYSTFNGNILSAKQIILQTGAVLNGRALAQTQVTLDANTVSASSAPVTPPPAVTPPVTPAPTPSPSSGSSSGAYTNAPATPAANNNSTGTPAVTTTGGTANPVPATAKTYREAVKMAHNQYLKDMKDARAAFRDAMKTARADHSPAEKISALKAYNAARKAPLKALLDAISAARTAFKYR